MCSTLKAGQNIDRNSHRAHFSAKGSLRNDNFYKITYFDFDLSRFDEIKKERSRVFTATQLLIHMQT